MRIVGGFLGSRRLEKPPEGVRPTSDRVREALFARLESLGGLHGQRVLDVYAGTGALGIEAISRGASSVVFVDRAAGAIRVLQANLEKLGIADRAHVLRGDACRSLRWLAREGRRFELVFLDPPYASQEVERATAALVNEGLLAEGARVVLETPKRHSPAPTAGFAVVDTRSYGDTAISFLAVERDDSASGTGGALQVTTDKSDEEEVGENG
jgi:16S rRNA (guanine966-N2)-methyltransferase